MQLTALGTTIFQSSGDNGLHALDVTPCPPFSPIYPGTCPFVVVVGGTQGYQTEVAIDEAGPAGYATGLGWSKYFSFPPFMADAVNPYVASLGGKESGFFDAKKRPYPDIAARGDRHAIIEHGKKVYKTGTSASTPLWAGVATRINSKRRDAGRGKIGWLNPVIYKYPGAFNDIQVGSSSGCGPHSFPAGPGWDLVTGQGSPNYPGRECERLGSHVNYGFLLSLPTAYGPATFFRPPQC